MNQTKILHDALKVLKIDGSESIINSSHVSIAWERFSCFKTFLFTSGELKSFRGIRITNFQTLSERIIIEFQPNAFRTNYIC